MWNGEVNSLELLYLEEKATRLAHIERPVTQYYGKENLRKKGDDDWEILHLKAASTIRRWVM